MSAQVNNKKEQEVQLSQTDQNTRPRLQ